MDIILYHGRCSDGWCAAYVASKRYPEAELLACDHGIEPPYEKIVNKDVLVFDFSWPTREQNDRVASLTKSFHIFDHHRTAQDVLEGAAYATFDMNRSGAGLAWDYLFGKDSNNAQCKPRPWFVNFTEDRDLWTWKLPNSKEVCAFLGTLEFTKEVWDKLI